MALRLILRDGIIYVWGSMNGVRVRESTGFRETRKVDALHRMREIEGEIYAGKYLAPSQRGKVFHPEGQRIFDEAAEDYMKWLRVRGRNAEGVRKMVDVLLPIWGGVGVGRITTEKVEEWVLEMSGRGLKPGSIKRYLATFGAIMRAAMKWKWIAEMPEIPQITVDDARDEHFTETEVLDFLEAVRTKHPRHYMEFMVLTYTGVRRGEMGAMRWRDVHGGHIEVKKKVHGKARKARMIPMVEDLEKMMEAARKGPNEKVFVNDAGQPWNIDTLGNRLQIVMDTIVEETGLPRLRVHDLRHTFAFLVAQKGGDLGDLQYLMGHTNIAMTMRYRGFIPSRSMDVVKNLR
jgi:integrase